MALHPCNIQGYNNEIQIAGSDAAIGHNPENKTRVSAADNDSTSAEKRQSAMAQEEKKNALVAVGVAGGLAALWLSSERDRQLLVVVLKEDFILTFFRHLHPNGCLAYPTTVGSSSRSSLV